MITIVLAVAFAAGTSASVDCSTIAEAQAPWPATDTDVFTMRAPPGYKYRRIEMTSGSAGRWVCRGDKGQSAIVFTVGSLGKFRDEYVTSTCTETIGGREARVKTGIGPSGRYFVLVEWLKPLAEGRDTFLVVWADTADPAEQLEALAAIRTVDMDGK